ncbi:MAG TPA: SMC-Scp complex subunit ScpB [Opitutaceae bacterium]
MSSSQPLSLKDIQAAFARFHEQPDALAEADAEAEAGRSGGSPLQNEEKSGGDAASTVAEPIATATEEPVLIPESAEESELYRDVPSLITAAQIREAMDEIANELKVADDGLLLIEGANGYRLATHPRYGRWVRILRQEPPPVKLSQSSLETMAVVAYRQPVTRGEIENIRGVSAEAGINKLLERELIVIVGRADLPGRPIQYGTTDHFLEFVGIKSLDELPASDVLSSRQIDEWLRTNQSPSKPTDKDMGLEEEASPAEAGAGPGSSAEPALADSPVETSESLSEPGPSEAPPGQTG